jgi:hypothetical protein
VRVTVIADPVLIGCPTGHAARQADAERWAERLAAAGVPARATRTIAAELWAKVFYSAALNPLGALLGVTYGALAAGADTRAVMDTVIDEAFAVARAEGGVHLVALSQRELAACGRDACVADDHAHVVQGCAWIEDRIQQPGGYGCVQRRAALGQARQPDGALDGDDSPNLIAGKVLRAFDQFIDRLFHIAPGAAKEPGLADGYQGAAQLGLEDDGEGEEDGDEEGAVEELDSLEAEAVGDEVECDVGDDEEEGGALVEPGAAGAAEEAHDGVDDGGDEQPFDEDDPAVAGDQAEIFGQLMHGEGLSAILLY